MTMMHEQVHRGAGKNYQVGKPLKKMLAMLYQ
jgi:hypothetical protein